MSTLEQLQSSLEALTTQRRQIVEAGWFLQHCWLVQVKPGGTARTNSRYWQVRSRQPIFDGKTLKHLKSDEVEAYRAAIKRGQQLSQIDRQLAKLQQQLKKLAYPTDASSQLSKLTPQISPQISKFTSQQQPSQVPILPTEKLLQRAEEHLPMKFTNLADQERLVQEVLANSQSLRALLRQSLALCRRSGAKNVDLRVDLRKEPLD